jgi:hypothetical protein
MSIILIVSTHDNVSKINPWACSYFLTDFPDRFRRRQGRGGAEYVITFDLANARLWLAKAR